MELRVTEMRIKSSGFTVIEIIVVIVIMAIAAVCAIPLMSSAGSTQIRSAANVVASDLEYAKSMAIANQKNYTVVFNPGNESYQIEDADGVIDHPVKKCPYVMNFSTDSRLNRVGIDSVSFSGNSVTFDSLGIPDNGGNVILGATDATATVSVEDVTGFISIN